MSKSLSLVESSEIINVFRQFLKSCEYHERSIRDYSKYVSGFMMSEFYSDNSKTLEKKLNAYLEYAKHKNLQSFKHIRAAIHLFYYMEVGKPLVSHEITSENQEIEKYLILLQNYLKDIRGLSQATIASELSHSQRFLKFIEQDQKSLDMEKVTAMDIVNFCIKELSGLKPSSQGRIATSIRNLFRCLQFNRYLIDSSIFRLPLTPAVWKSANLPVVLDKTDIEKIKSIYTHDTPAQIRNNAIMLCFTELGLRCMEVARLSLDDFQWSEGIVTIRNTKTLVERKLPMSKILGNAIAHYLQDARPVTSNRILFLRFAHKCGDSMGREQIRGVVRRAYDKAGMPKSLTGTHILRKTVASSLYNNGNSLKMVADILGHQSIDSTTTYTKLNIKQLSEAASAWPGGGCNVK